jgi:hypothetical protein
MTETNALTFNDTEITMEFFKFNSTGTMTLGITTFSIMTLRIMTLSITTFSIMNLFATLSINDTQHNNTLH